MILTGVIFGSACVKKPVEYKTRDFIVVEARQDDTLNSLARQYLNDDKKSWMIAEFNKIKTITPGQKIIIPLNPFNKGGLNPDGYQLTPVLCFESFNTNGPVKNTDAPSIFEQRLVYLKNNNFQVISLSRFMDFIDYSAQIPEKSVVITIDDNSPVVSDWVVPLLEKYAYPATLFVDTRNIGKDGFLSYPQLKNLYSRGIEIASRSGWGIDSDIEKKQLSMKDYFFNIEKEISISKSTLERETGGKCIFYALPPAGGNTLLINLLKKKGFKAAFNLSGESNPFYSDTYNINRITVPATSSIKEFETALIVYRKIELK